MHCFPEVWRLQDVAKYSLQQTWHKSVDPHEGRLMNVLLLHSWRIFCRPLVSLLYVSSNYSILSCKLTVQYVHCCRLCKSNTISDVIWGQNIITFYAPVNLTRIFVGEIARAVRLVPFGAHKYREFQGPTPRVLDLAT